MDFLSYLSSKKKIRLPLSFLVAIVSFMLCSHRLYGIRIYNFTKKKITILSFVETVSSTMRESGSAKCFFNIDDKNNTILPYNSVNIENRVTSYSYMGTSEFEASFFYLSINVKHGDKEYTFNTKMIKKCKRKQLKKDELVIRFRFPSSENSRNKNYFDKDGKKNDLNMRFALKSNMPQEKP